MLNLQSVVRKHILRNPLFSVITRRILPSRDQFSATSRRKTEVTHKHILYTTWYLNSLIGFTRLHPFQNCIYLLRKAKTDRKWLWSLAKHHILQLSGKTKGRQEKWTALRKIHGQTINWTYKIFINNSVQFRYLLCPRSTVLSKLWALRLQLQVFQWIKASVVGKHLQQLDVWSWSICLVGLIIKMFNQKASKYAVECFDGFVLTIWGALAKLRKATLSFVMSICLSVCLFILPPA